MRLLVLRSFLGALASAVSAQAQDVELDWKGPPNCSDKSTALVGMAPEEVHSVEPADRVVAQVELTAQEAGFHLSFSGTYLGARFERTLEVDSCEEAQRATALFISLVLAPHSRESVESPADAPPPPLPPPENEEAALGTSAAPHPESVVEEGSPPAPQPDSSRGARRPFFLMRGGAFFDSSSLPYQASGPELAIGVGSGRFFAEVGSHYLPGRREMYEREARSTTAERELFVRVSAVGANTKLGWLYQTGPFQFGPVAGAGVQWLWTSSNGDDALRSVRRSYVELEFGAALTADILENLRVYLTPGAKFALARPTLNFAPVSDSHRVAPASLWISSGVWLQF